MCVCVGCTTHWAALTFIIRREVVLSSCGPLAKGTGTPVCQFDGCCDSSPLETWPMRSLRWASNQAIGRCPVMTVNSTDRLCWQCLLASGLAKWLTSFRLASRQWSSNAMSCMDSRQAVCMLGLGLGMKAELRAWKRGRSELAG